MQGSISKATVFAEANKGRGVCHVPPLLKVKDDYSRINSIIIGGKKNLDLLDHPIFISGLSV